MTVDTAKSGRTVALAHGKTGVHASVDGDTPRSFPIKGELNADSLAAALELFANDAGTTATILIIGTRADGTPGWDAVDPDELVKATPHQVFFFSEAEALNLEPSDREPTAWIILATTGSGSTLKGSARWWMQHPEEGTVERADVFYGGINYGQIFTLSGDNLADSPILVASLVEALIARHSVKRVYVWSQDGLAGHWAYMQTADSSTPPERKTFWGALRLPESYVAAGNDVVIVPSALSVLDIASKNGIPLTTTPPAKVTEKEDAEEETE